MSEGGKIPESTTTTPEAATPTEGAADASTDTAAAEAISKASLEPAAAEENEPPVSLVQPGALDPADETAEVEIVASNELAEHLQSSESFEKLGLPEPLLKAVYRLKFTKPSVIQAKTIPAILKGVNILGQAQTGSGKTACFALGMLYHTDPSQKYTQAMCLAISRELAYQLYHATVDLAHFLPEISIKICVPQTYGAPRPEAREIVNEHIVVGTPGQILHMIQRRQLNLRNLKIFVVDEADAMVGQQSLGDQTLRLYRSVPKTAQVLLFSATYEQEQVKAMAKTMIREPSLEVLVKREALSLEGIKNFAVYCNKELVKLAVLDDIFSLLTVGQTIIFVKKKADADALAAELEAKNHAVSKLHGDVDRGERDRVMEEFRAGKTRVLLCTNVLARGIDVLQVTLTVNYDIPVTQEGAPDTETYLHRSGRSARFGRKGVTLNLVDGPRSASALQGITEHWNLDMQTLNPDSIEDTLGAALKQVR